MTSNEYLKHHGVLGMKWGIRRYQNADGSYTAAGRKKYGLDLDVNDKRRKNVAKIRRGEAQRRLDVAKNNNDTNKTRQAELQGRLRTAKKEVRNANKVDKGAALAAEGKTLTAEKMKRKGASAIAVFGPKLLTESINVYKNASIANGSWNNSKHVTAALINKYGSYAIMTAATAYGIKKSSNVRNLRAYERARANNTLSLKNVGSDEYAARVKRAKKG